MMRADVRPYREEHWPALRRLLAEHWRADLPLLDKRLFDWQYRGYGPLASPTGERGGDRPSRLVFLRGELIGFYGAIPGVYRLAAGATAGAAVPGLAMALWIVHADYRNLGFGIFLLRALEQQSPVTVTLGANEDTIHYLSGARYALLGALHRWVVPLEADGYRALCTRPTDAEAIRAWSGGVARAEPLRPMDPSAREAARELADRWQRCAPEDCLMLERSADFYQWRYLDSAGFRYAAFAGPGASLAVARLERVVDPEAPARDGRTVFRIIELWLDSAGRTASGFIAGLLAWAREQGACAADFQCSNRRLTDALSSAGFRAQSADYGPAACSLAGLFGPFRRTAPPINALWRVAGPAGGPPPAEQTWLLKSDGDMDRPNIWRDSRSPD